MANYKILSDAQIRAALAELPDWSLKAPNIEAKFELKTFRDAIAFIVEVAIQAELMNHHPEFHNSYNILTFSFCTHDAGMKIPDLDIATAKYISALARCSCAIRLRPKRKPYFGSCWRRRHWSSSSPVPTLRI